MLIYSDHLHINLLTSMAMNIIISITFSSISLPLMFFSNIIYIYKENDFVLSIKK